MKNHRPGYTAILLFTLAASPAVFADPAAPLPDMSAALQSRIDGRLAATLDHRAGERREIPSKHSATRGTQQSSTSGSGRTDEPGWKPYHSAM